MEIKQRMNYIGSKYSLLNYLNEKIKENVKNTKDLVFCDIFAGTQIVGNFFKKDFKKIISNDIEYYSYVIGRNYIKNNKSFEYSELLEELNEIEGVKGNIFHQYSEGGDKNRLFFNSHNGQKIDAIRQKIESYKDLLYIDDSIYYFLITSLIEAADKVANTTSVYGAFLKQLKKTAIKDIMLKPPLFDIVENQINDVYNQDSNDLIKSIKGDVLYIDPPYNHRQYGSNYHILNAISKYDFNIEPRGIVGVMDYNKSKYCYKKEAKLVFEDIIKNSNFNHIFISYNNEGILKEDDFNNILSSYGKVIRYDREYKTYKADKNRSNKSKNTIEYLFYMKR